MKLKNIIYDILNNKKSIESLDTADLRTAFQETLNNSLENASLAHFNYAIQDLSRKLYDRITPIVYEEVDFLPSENKAAVRYIRGGYIISVTKGLSATEKRFYIGHELGHILISILDDKIYDYFRHKNDVQREKLADILSVLMIFSQSNFYEHQSKDFIYNTKEKLSELNNFISHN